LVSILAQSGVAYTICFRLLYRQYEVNKYLYECTASVSFFSVVFTVVGIIDLTFNQHGES